MAATFTCLGCGRLTPDDDNGCLVCDLCEACTPAEGNCLDCAEQRRVEQSERMRRAQRDVIW